MKIAIMQPYFFPYIGYFQLMSAVDEFVVYDNIKYVKKGWINRNRILADGRDVYITLPLRSGSDSLDVKERLLSDTWQNERKKLLNRIVENYRKAPNFKSAFPLIEECIMFEEYNLFNFIYNSLMKTREYLDIKGKVTISSSVKIDHSLKSEEKVIAICRHQSASTYINPIGGLELYSKHNFMEYQLNLEFLKVDGVQYKQFSGKQFVPSLSIIDVIMFNSKDEVQRLLENYQILNNV